MKALLSLLISMVLLYPIAGVACDLCSQWEHSTCTIPDRCFPSDYYRQLDKSITYCFNVAGPTFQLRFNEAVAAWTSVAAISISEVTGGQEMDVAWVANTVASEVTANTFITRDPNTGGMVATRVEVYSNIISHTTQNPLTWDWGTTCPWATDEVSLKHVLLHELGHAIGLCLFSEPFTGSVMVEPSDDECHVDLQGIDTLCARFLYQATALSRCAQFTPVLRGDGVSIGWHTEYEYETSHFMLEKKQDDGSFASISEAIMSAGSAFEGADYEYFDPAGTRSNIYRLIEVDKNGIERGAAEGGVALKEPSGKAPIVLSDAERTQLHKDIATMLKGEGPDKTKALKTVTSTGIQWLAIYPAAFSDAIVPLITYRNYHGFDASGATYEDIQSQYGTIKAYLQNLWNAGGHSLTYVLIVGDDGQIPAERCNDGDVGDYYAHYYTDVITVDLTGDWLPELSVGRIPAGSADEVSLYVAKVLEYEGQAAADWNNHITFFVEDRSGLYGYQSGPVAASFAEQLTELVPSTRSLHYKNILGSLPYDQCSQRSQAIGEFDAGRGTVLAFGSMADYHGLVGWLDTHEYYEGCAFAGTQLAQSNKYAFVLGASCDIGSMSANSLPWILKELLFQRHSGAIACFAPSGATWQGANYAICASMLNYLYNWGTPTIGYACYSAQKAEMADPLPGNAHTARSYIFYGDPAIRLKGSVSGSSPVVTVTCPNGNEHYTTPQVVPITWGVQDDDLGGIRCTVLINYNSGSGNWTSLVSGITVDGNGHGSYNYQLPCGNIVYAHCRIKVLATDACSNQGSDVSNGDFTIELLTKPSNEPIPIDPVSGRPIVPKDNFLSAPYPNPFNPRTSIRFGLKEPTQASLVIYDVTGAVVKSLYENSSLAPGEYLVNWDGTNERGSKAASGVYFLRLKAGNYSKTQRMVLLR